MPETISGVPVAPEKGGRSRRRPEYYIGLKNSYIPKLNQFGIPVPSKNLNDYEVPVNTNEAVVLFNGDSQSELNSDNKKRYMAAAIAKYKQSFKKAYEEDKFQRGHQYLKNAGIAKKLNFGNENRNRNRNNANVSSPSEEKEESAPLARSLFRKSRSARTSRKTRKTRQRK